MNKTLLKADLKANWGILLFIAVMLLIYVVTSVSMFDPDSIDALDGMLKVLPEGMVKAFGFDGLGTDLTGYLANYLYGFIFIVFPVIYIILLANNLIAKHVDSGSMAYLLTTPNSRVRIAATQAIYLISSLAFIFIVETVIAIAMSESLFKGLLNIQKFLALNLVTYLVLAVVGGIGFFFSCLLNDIRSTLALSGGIPLAFLVFKMVSEISTDLVWMKYITIFSVIDIDKILTDNTYVIVSSLILTGVGAVLYTGAVLIFNRKSLSI